MILLYSLSSNMNVMRIARCNTFLLCVLELQTLPFLPQKEVNFLTMSALCICVLHYDHRHT